MAQHAGRTEQVTVLRACLTAVEGQALEDARTGLDRDMLVELAARFPRPATAGERIHHNRTVLGTLGVANDSEMTSALRRATRPR